MNPQQLEQLKRNIAVLESQGAPQEDIQSYINQSTQGQSTVQPQQPLDTPQTFGSGFRDVFQRAGNDVALAQQGQQENNSLGSLFKTSATMLLQGGLAIPRAIGAGLASTRQGQFMIGNVVEKLTDFGEAITPQSVQDYIGKTANEVIAGYNSMTPQEQLTQRNRLALAETLSYFVGGSTAKNAVISPTIRGMERVMSSSESLVGKGLKSFDIKEPKSVPEAVQTLEKAFYRGFVEDNASVLKGFEKIIARDSIPDSPVTRSTLMRDLISTGTFPKLIGKRADFTESVARISDRQAQIGASIDDILRPRTEMTDLLDLRAETETILRNSPQVDVGLSSALNQVERFFEGLNQKTMKNPGFVTGKMNPIQINQVRKNMNQLTKAFRQEDFNQDVADAVADAIRTRLDAIDVGVRAANKEWARLQRVKRTARVLQFQPVNIGVLGNQVGRLGAVTVLGATGLAAGMGPGSLVIAGIIAHFGGDTFAGLLRKRLLSPKAQKVILESIKDNPNFAKEIVNSASGKNKELLIKALYDGKKEPKFEELPSTPLAVSGSSEIENLPIENRSFNSGEIPQTNQRSPRDISSSPINNKNNTSITPTIPQKKGIVSRAVDSLKESIKNPSIGLATKNVGDEATTLNRATEYLREAKGLSANDIMAKYPDIQLKRDVPVTDIHGHKMEIPEGEVLTPYELKGNKVLLQDGKTYIVSKNQFQNVKGNALSGEAKDFAPELKGTEEKVLGGEFKGAKEAQAEFDKLNNRSTELVVKYPRESRTQAQQAELDAIGDKMNALHDKYNGDYDFIAKQVTKRSDTKYSSYTLPGGENYKEILIQATKGNTGKITTGEISQKLFNKPMSELTDAERVKVSEFARKEDTNPIKSPFVSSHWSEPNVISHLRLNERTYKGKKVTFMEELQSDWAREGKSQGFLKDTNAQELEAAQILKKYDIKLDEYKSSNQKGVYEAIDSAADNNFGTISDVDQTKLISLSEEAYQAIRGEKGGGGIPNNPLLKNWQIPTIKRALQEAVANKSEYFAWINGDQTSARYNLATYVEDVKWGTGKTMDIGPGSTKTIKLTPKQEANRLEFGIDDSGIIRSVEDGVDPSWRGKKLDEVLGKGLADSIMSKESGTLSGEGLKFGGEWATNLYGDAPVIDIPTEPMTKTGQPVLIKSYHGTSKKFDEFKIQKSGVRYTGDGIYFTPDIEGAKHFAGENGRVIEAELDLKNPYNLYLPEGNFDWQPGNEKIREIINKGHDSIIVRFKDIDSATGKIEGDYINEIVVFDTNVIKKSDSSLSSPFTSDGNVQPKIGQVGNIVKDLTGAKIEVLDMGLPVEKGTPSGHWYKDGKELIGGEFSGLKVGDKIGRGTSVNYKIIAIKDGKITAEPIRSKGFLPSLEAQTETFDISQKTTTQQGIRLTPEVKAIIEGKSPLTKKPQQPPLEEFLAIRNRALNQ